MPETKKKSPKSLHRTATVVKGTSATKLEWDVQPDATHVLTVHEGEKPPVIHYFKASETLRKWVRSYYGQVRWSPALKGGFGLRTHRTKPSGNRRR